MKTGAILDCLTALLRLLEANGVSLEVSAIFIGVLLASRALSMISPVSQAGARRRRRRERSKSGHKAWRRKIGTEMGGETKSKHRCIESK